MVRARLPGFNTALAAMLVAVTLLPVLGLGTVLAARLIASGNTRAYPIVALNHLATLLWGTLTAIGAVYQLFPAMTGAAHRAGKGAVAQMAATGAGAVLMILGFLTRGPHLIAVGGTILWFGILAFVLSVAGMARRARHLSLPAKGIVASCMYLGLAATWGWLMSENLAHRFWPALAGYGGVGAHAALGLGGWFAQLVVSASYHLLPRFARASGPTPTTLPIVLGGINAGVAALVVAAVVGIAPAARVGALVLAASAMLYAHELRRILQTSTQRKPDLTLRHWWMIFACTIALAALGAAWAFGLLPMPGQRVAAAAVILLVLAWLTLAIMGQLYKVTPFLIWHYRFARRLGPDAVSRLPAPYHPGGGVAPMWLTAAGSTGLATAALLGNAPLAVGGAAAFLTGTLGFWWVMAGSWLPRLMGRD